MENFVFMVESSCSDPSRETEFNEWYNNIHVQDVLKTGIVKRATRYELTAEPSEDRGKFLAVYELDTDDIDSTMKLYADKMSVIGKDRQNALLKPVRRSIYKKIASFEARK